MADGFAEAPAAPCAVSTAAIEELMLAEVACSLLASVSAGSSPCGLPRSCVATYSGGLRACTVPRGPQDNGHKTPQIINKSRLVAGRAHSALNFQQVRHSVNCSR